jgi:hypothetical protein
MKRLIKRFVLKHRLASAAAQLDGITRERKQLEQLEHALLVKANRARLDLLMMDVRERRHA